MPTSVAWGELSSHQILLVECSMMNTKHSAGRKHTHSLASSRIRPDSRRHRQFGCEKTLKFSKTIELPTLHLGLGHARPGGLGAVRSSSSYKERKFVWPKAGAICRSPGGDPSAEMPPKQHEQRGLLQCGFTIAVGGGRRPSQCLLSKGGRQQQKQAGLPAPLELAYNVGLIVLMNKFG